MNTSQIKTFAINSRQILKQGVINKISSLGFNPQGEPVFGLPQKIQGATVYAGKILDESFYDAWMALKHRIEIKGIKDVYEEAAYTWFNRLVAIRIMQKNGYIEPVLQYSSEETRIPRIVAEARAGHIVTDMTASDRAKLEELLNDDSKTTEQFTLLIENFCKYNPVIFNCFGGIEKYISILLPDNILAQGGFIDLLNHTTYITDEDYTKSELIGWLYQFYISEKKDEVFDSLKKGKKAEAEDIPAATQIFTPNWIVKYMVQNTVGRIYLDNNPYSELGSEMKYLVGDKTPDEAILHLDDLADYKMIDPACGSGHILVEAFDLFYSMYREEGYSSRQAVESILKKNIIGIDLDTRAKQLATFALLMKAVKADESFLDCEVLPCVLDMPRPYTEWTQNLSDAIERFYMGCSDKVKKETLDAFELLTHAENLGSIMKFDFSDETRNLMQIRNREWVEQGVLNDVNANIVESINLMLALSNRYVSVVANPPYMGLANMNEDLNSYVTQHYSIGKADLCTVFMLQFRALCNEFGGYSFIIPPSWMFLSSFESIRRTLIDEQIIKSIAHLSNGVFGGDFGSTVNVIFNYSDSQALGTYIRAVEKTFQMIENDDIRQIVEAAITNPCFKFNFKTYKKGISQIVHSDDGNTVLYSSIPQNSFERIPGAPIGYWVSDYEQSLFEKGTIEKYARPCKGIDTGDNGYFLRLWHEVALNKIDDSRGEGDWVPYNKGGDFRRWFGNRDYVLRWNGSDEELSSRLKLTKKKPTLRNKDRWFKESFTWTSVTASTYSARYSPAGAMFDNGGSSIFSPNHLFVIGGLINSVVARRYFDVLSPSINYQPGEIGNLPYSGVLAETGSLIYEGIKDLVGSNIKISKYDWDSHETSWDFKANELIALKNEVFLSINGEKQSIPTLLTEILEDYKSKWSRLFYQLHSNEEELNRQFIEIYGLQDELTPDVPLEEITILQQGEISIENNEIVWHDDVIIKQLISYAVGCWMGRYRLDKPGLHIAHPNPSSEEVCTYQYNGHDFAIDDDGIIPMMSCDSMFEDNGYNRIVEFIKVAFGEDNFTENLNFIEKALGKSLEDYMMKDFWKDHKKMYQNRPIYWLFSSKKGAFQCMVYMHRMNPYTAERVRTKYLLKHIDDLKGRIATASERAALLTTVERRNLAKMQKDLDECLEYHDVLHEVADQQIGFDLDDGVVVNYAKFGDVLAKIK
mgnify:CR=1 FL=1